MMFGLTETMQQFFSQQVELYGDDVVLPSALLQQIYEQQKTDENEQQLPKDAPVNIGLVKSGNLDSGILIIADTMLTLGDETEFDYQSPKGKLLINILNAIDLVPSRVCSLTFTMNKDQEKHLVELNEQLNTFITNSRCKYVLCFGHYAARLLKLTEPVNALRGRIFDYHSLRLLVTHHPGDLMTNKKLKYETWDDIKKFKSMYSE